MEEMKFYTHEEVKEVIRYAADRHIIVIPEIDIPGHCMAVLATYPQFSTTPDEQKKAALTSETLLSKRDKPKT